MRTITEISEHGLMLSDGTKIADFHKQDCCENVYADWKAGFEDVDLSTFDLTDIWIAPVYDKGFRLNGQFVPCYNEQNGYYASDLSIDVTDPEGKVIESIEVEVEDQIH